ncbi:MAG: DHH family phosphoesterase [Thermodesulfobacteriota bacterium]
MNTQRWDLTKSTHKLTELEAVVRGAGKKKVLILCHNNPDPDSIASAYGLSFLMTKAFGVRSVIGYGGVVTRAENKAMVQRLRIKMNQMSRVVPSRYYGMAAVDAQPGTGNNLLKPDMSPPFIVIDHHPLRKLSLKAEFYDVRPHYGATSTIITEYILAAELTPTRSLANALLYGLKTDTRSLVRAGSRADFEAFNYLSPLSNPRVIGAIERPGLSQQYFRDFHRGLSNTVLYRDVAVSYLGKIDSEAIVPELADWLLRIDGVSWSLCMGEMGNLMILSLRSTSRKYRSGGVIRQLVDRIGSAGGHREMAGGQIPLTGLSRSERRQLPVQLVARFLKLIKREKIGPKPLVGIPGPNE